MENHGEGIRPRSSPPPNGSFSTAEIREYLDDLEPTKFLAPFEPEVEDGEEEELWLDNPIPGAQELLRFSRIRQMLQA